MAHDGQHGFILGQHVGYNGRFLGVALIVLDVQGQGDAVNAAGGVDLLHIKLGTFQGVLPILGGSAGQRAHKADDILGYFLFAATGTGKKHGDGQQNC